MILTYRIDVIAYYATIVFQSSVKMSPHLSLIMGGLTAIAFLCGTLVAVGIIDVVGRRSVSSIHPLTLHSCVPDLRS